MSKETRELKLQKAIVDGNVFPQKHYPVLLLKGKWLKDCGFLPESKVQVIVKEKLLVIKPIED